MSVVVVTVSLCVSVCVCVCVCVIGEVDGFPHKASLNNFQLYITGLHLHLCEPNAQLM